MIELPTQDSTAFQDILSVLRSHPELKKWTMIDEPILSFPGLDIYPRRRKVFRNHQEIQLTHKEYEILLLLVTNKGWVLTYNQIYEKIWNDFPTGNERNTIGFHICNLREKLYQAAPNAPFTIRSVREVGYCFEIQAEK
ncbi:transcriptional regulator [Anaeromassilibacillus sp. An172]|jgi:DNA-binding response OmpR family regulator|uniref:winged helix-turn-helix domain-containing protein n=1 Tax=Anaeromassilibacillus sp. An172 TaxID=1965570 RepID=UPI000B3874E8|nr:winged helix-turn-helix domain-containing protein [Anaeromassilibacillus sp. An172]OUP80135.1 transcriptional regulator [Anaeromassilibacillus sp. An172]